MLARLWWKEWRVFGPACLLLVLGAAGVQWIYLAGNGAYARDGSATPMALIWAVLYAYAVGAAAFAGEREGKTIGFLDALPVGRRTLWLGKSSFAVTSTAVLVVALVGLSMLGTERRNEEQYGLQQLAGNFAIWIAEGLAWGLFWSSLLANPLAAGVLAVGSVATVAILTNLFVGLSADADAQFDRTRLLMAGLALAGSAVVMIGRVRALRFVFPWRLERVATQSPTAPAAPAVRRASVTRSLVWQAWREGAAGWLLALALALWVPAFKTLSGVTGDPSLDVVLPTLACLMIGIAVFGQDNAAGTRRFLLHHGVAPGSAWGRKMLAWGFPIAILTVALLALLSARSDRFVMPDRRGLAAVCLVATLLDAFALGVVCGMASRRRITGALVAVIALIALAPIQVVAATQDMVPAWTLLLSPLILFGVSRAWAGDWLADRGGYRPYARLALLMVVPFGLEAVAYAAYRAWGEPYAAPIAAIAPTPAGSISAGEDAAEAFRKAAELIWTGDPRGVGLDRNDINRIIEEGWDPRVAGLDSYLLRHRPALEAARKAAAMPRISAGETSSPTSNPGDPMILRFRDLGRLLALEARERQSRGDLPGAWDDILAQLRMAGQLTADWPTRARTFQSAQLHHQAVGLAIDWASDPKQAPATIKRAFDDVRALPPPTNMARSLQVEAAEAERWLALPADELGDAFNSNAHSSARTTSQRLAFALLVAPPWEREHARRVCRRIFAEQIRGVQQEPWRRDAALVGQSTDPHSPALRGSNLVRMLLPATEAAIRPFDRELENRRALELTLALRLWQLEHGGNYPETLEALVPSILDRLPLDPYSGRPFGYTRSGGQPVQPPIRGDQYDYFHEHLRATAPGQRLLYSIGPDGHDEGAARSYLLGDPSGKQGGDLIIPLP